MGLAVLKLQKNENNFKLYFRENKNQCIILALPAWIPIRNPAELPTLDGGEPDLLRVRLKLALKMNEKKYIHSVSFISNAVNFQPVSNLRFSVVVACVCCLVSKKITDFQRKNKIFDRFI